MTTTLQSHGGGAQPASIDASGKVTGGTALRVYGFDTPEAAQAAGYVCEGGPAMSVALITDAQIASGAWKAEGDPSATVIYTAPSSMPVEGGYAVPIYAVNGWGSTPAPEPSGPPVIASATLLFGQLAKNLGLSEGDPAGLFNDQYSGLHNDFTSTGSARPTYHDGTQAPNLGVPYIQFDGIDDYMAAGNFADNLDNIGIIMYLSTFFTNLSFNPVISKCNNSSNGAGWGVYSSRAALILQEDGGSVWMSVSNTDYLFAPNPFMMTYTTNRVASNVRAYINGSNAHQLVEVDAGPVLNYSNSEVVRLARFGSPDIDGFGEPAFHALFIYQINDLVTWNATDRAAIETWVLANA